MTLFKFDLFSLIFDLSSLTYFVLELLSSQIEIKYVKKDTSDLSNHQPCQTVAKGKRTRIADMHIAQEAQIEEKSAPIDRKGNAQAHKRLQNNEIKIITSDFEILKCV